MSEFSRMRSAAPGVKLPSVWLIDPKGNPVKMQLARNINNGVVRIEDDGTTSLINKAKRAGWRYMQENCSAKEWAFWKAYDEACEAGKRLRKPSKAQMPACIGVAAPTEAKQEFVFESPEGEDDTPDDAKPAKRGKA